MSNTNNNENNAISGESIEPELLAVADTVNQVVKNTQSNVRYMAVKNPKGNNKTNAEFGALVSGEEYLQKIEIDATHPLGMSNLLKVSDTVNPEVEIELRNTRDQYVLVFGDTHLGQDRAQESFNVLVEGVKNLNNSGKSITSIIDMGDFIDQAGKPVALQESTESPDKTITSKEAIAEQWKMAAKDTVAERVKLAHAAGISLNNYFVITGNHDLPRAPDGLTQDEKNTFEKEVLATWKQLHEEAGLTLLTTRPDEIWKGKIPGIHGGNVQLRHYVANSGEVLESAILDSFESLEESVRKKIENAFSLVPGSVVYAIGADLHTPLHVIRGSHWDRSNGNNFLNTILSPKLGEGGYVILHGNSVYGVDKNGKITLPPLKRGVIAASQFNGIPNNEQDPFHTFQVTTQKLERGEEDQSRIAA